MSTPRARQFAQTLQGLAQDHGKPELQTLAGSIVEKFILTGREMTTADEDAVLNAAAAAFKTLREVSREDHRHTRTTDREQAPSGDRRTERG